MARSRNSKGKTREKRSTNRSQPSATSGGGYGKPPEHSRWKPGQSGNPGGRPRKLQAIPFSQKLDPIRNLILEEMGRIVEIKEGGQRIGIEAARAIVRSVAIGAMQGDLRKQKLVLQIAAAAEQSSKADRAESIKFVTFYKAKFDVQKYSDLSIVQEAAARLR